MIPWWARDKKLRFAKVARDTHVILSVGPSATLPKNSLITPVRKDYLPRDHRWREYCDETQEMVADTHLGLCRISLDDVDM